MKNLRYCSIFFLSVSIFYSNPIVANEATYAEAEEQISKSYNLLSDIKTGLYNLGNYFGFDLTATPQTVSSSVFKIDGQKTIEQTTVSSLFYILSANTTFPNFFAGISAYKAFDAEANALFNNNNLPPISNVDVTLDSSNSNSNPINPLSQSLLNILSITPDSNCINTSQNNSLLSPCPFNYIESNEYAAALGFQSIPTSNILTSSTSTSQTGDCNDGLCNISNVITAYFLNPNTGSPNGSQAYLLKQIDSSLFLSPLIYDTESLSSQTQSSSEGQGLSNNSQMQAASNYVKYVSGTLLPKSLADQSTIKDKNSIITSFSSDTKTRMQAFHDLLGYVLGLRVYAAQMSLPMQNFYESLAKRMVLPTDASSSQKTSQALNEFVMASYRLYTPSSSNDGGPATSAWQDMLNTASPATVQKETALILAEINYQLYQMRQQQEKLLLIQSSQLMNSLRPPVLVSDSN